MVVGAWGCIHSLHSLEDGAVLSKTGGCCSFEDPRSEGQGYVDTAVYTVWAALGSELPILSQGNYEQGMGT